MFFWQHDIIEYTYSKMEFNKRNKEIFGKLFLPNVVQLRIRIKAEAPSTEPRQSGGSGETPQHVCVPQVQETTGMSVF